MYTLIKGPFSDTSNRQQSFVAKFSFYRIDASLQGGIWFFKKCDVLSGILEKNTSELGEPTVDPLILTFM